MEADKENYKKLKCLSRIPRPVNPLPAVTKYRRLDTHTKKNEEPQRAPLKTINCQEGPSKSTSCLHKTNTVLKVDSKIVTKRVNGDDCFDRIKIFNDESSVITISSDEDEADMGMCLSINESLGHDTTSNNSETNTLPPSQDNNATAVTPVEDTLHYSRMIKIKRCLKRPHSKELQSNANQLTRAYTKDLFSYLINAEKRPWTKEVGIPSGPRACALNWLMIVNMDPYVNPAILQTACWYLDTTLAHQIVYTEKLQLVATACYWVAQKLYGPGVPASEMVRCSNNAFTARELMAVEIVLLKTLKFPARPIIPDYFITFLSAWCDPDDPEELEVAASFLCVSGILVHPDTNLAYPSTVAAAAVMNAVLLIRNSRMMDKLCSCDVYKSARAKSRNFQVLMTIQRVAALKVADAKYEHKDPFQPFVVPFPVYIVQKVVKAANSLAMKD